MSREDALQQEQNTRVGQLVKQLTPLQPLLDAGVPTFFTGDFNSPSHRDWTRPAVQARGLPYPIRWPVSVTMEDVGFVDSYRAIHPDPVADPGFTWTPGYPAPYVTPSEVFDRIDFVWAAGPAVPTSSLVVGEDASNADLVIAPWPSDHRGMVSTFEVTPAPAPDLVAAEGERSHVGRPLDVYFHAPGGPGEDVALVDGETGTTLVDMQLGPPPAVDGTLRFDTAGLAQGTYDVVLLDGPVSSSRATRWCSSRRVSSRSSRSSTTRWRPPAPGDLVGLRTGQPVRLVRHLPRRPDAKSGSIRPGGTSADALRATR
jgi:hypothetical protein